MTTLYDAKRIVRQKLDQYQAKTPHRVAVLGDGRGTATSNLHVPSASNMVWAREHSQSKLAFPVANLAAVTPQVNLPVILGFDEREPEVEQILGVHFGGLAQGSDSGTVGPIGSHHQQHEFGGGDEVNIDGRLFVPGLVEPTSTPSMTVTINPFVYFWDHYRKYLGGTSISLTPYKPASPYSVVVTVCLDPETTEIVYREGHPYVDAIVQLTGQVFDNIVSGVTGNDIPLGFVILTSSTTTIDWTNTVNNLGDARLHAGYPALHLLERIQQLEGYTGNPPNLATTGAAETSVDEGGGGGASGVFSTGSVLFAGSSGAASEDNARFFWDDTDYRLIIGHNSPPSSFFNSGGKFILLRDEVETTNGASIGLVKVSDTGADSPVVFGARQQTSGAAVAISSRLFRVAASGHDGSNYVSARAYIDFTATEQWSTTAQGTRMGFSITDQTVTTQTEVFALSSASSPSTASTAQITQSVSSKGVLRILGVSVTGMTAESIDVSFALQHIVEFTSGALLATQRAVAISAPTYSATSAKTITIAATLAIVAAPTAGTNVTITSNYAFWALSASASSTFPGLFEVSDAATATSSTALHVLHSTSGTPTTTFGVDVILQLHDNGGTAVTAGKLRAAWIDATAGGTEAVTTLFASANSTDAVGLRIEGTSTSNEANAAFFAAGSFGSGRKVIFVVNATNAPSSNPTGGGILYSTAGGGTWRGSGGTTTTFGPAGPHCGVCGYDIWRVAAHNDIWRAYLYECGMCGMVYKGGPSKILDLLTYEQRNEILYPGMSMNDVMRVVGANSDHQAN